jgi:hypothetical protein
MSTQRHFMDGPINLRRPLITRRQKLEFEIQKELETIFEEIKRRKVLVLKKFSKIFMEPKPSPTKVDSIDRTKLSINNSDPMLVKDFLYIKVDEFLNLVMAFESNQRIYIPPNNDPLRGEWEELSKIKTVFQLISELSDKIYFLENPIKTSAPSSSHLALERGKRPY